MTTVIQLLLVLGLLVLVHEFGHFIVGKLCRVRIEAFAIGFGKRLIGFRHGETEYQINLLPLGGYVKFAGEIPGEDNTNDPGELNNHPRWQRVLIALAGPVANFILAFTVMLGICMTHYEVNQYESGPAVTDYISPASPVAATGIRAGDTILHFDDVENPNWDDVLNHAALNLNRTVPFSFLHQGQRVNTSLDIASTAKAPEDFDPGTLGFVPKMQDTPVKVSAIIPGTPAEHVGLKPEDQIASIDAVPIHSVPSLLAYMQDQKGKPANLDVVRNGQHLAIPITPQLSDVGDGTKAYHLGFAPVPPPVTVEHLSLAKSAKFSWNFSKKSSRLVVDVLRGMFQHHISVRSLSGPIGIAPVIHQAAEMKGWMPLVQVIANISINLGMLNLLPFPILDGGMIFLLIVESIFRRDLPMPIKERIFQVAFVCILIFGVLIVFNDITKLPFFAKLKS
ncbi:MAG TPA: RIP metalloprotease RseP [Acidobacteriaceae bacterium]|nr:RIP metalloprotease RseP [Acidobacteriaceae bacterium]